MRNCTVERVGEGGCGVVWCGGGGEGMWCVRVVEVAGRVWCGVWCDDSMGLSMRVCVRVRVRVRMCESASASPGAGRDESEWGQERVQR